MYYDMVGCFRNSVTYLKYNCNKFAYLSVHLIIQKKKLRIHKCHVRQFNAFCAASFQRTNLHKILYI